MNLLFSSRLPVRFLPLFAALALLSAAGFRAAAAEVTATFTSATTVPVTAASYTATGNTVSFTLAFAPPTGTTLTVLKNTGTAFIDGTFDNLAQGQKVNLAYGGVSYPFVANYYGGSGNDLVLQWANVRLLAWGRNTEGQLGNNETSNRSVPVPVDMRGVLAGKTVTAVSAGAYHGLVLCSDGTLAAWGENSQGQLGDNGFVNSSVPVAVDQTGVLAGKTVIAVAAGNSHNLALCSDGTLVAWGRNSWGELGLGNYANSIPVPQEVKTSGVLAGKRVIAIGAGYAHSVVLCVDGTLAAWGANVVGELGNNSKVDSREPVAVDQTGVLSGRTVIAIAVGGDHCLARCADGAIVAWGANGNGQLGNGSTIDSPVPVLSSWPGGFSGKVVSAIAAGANHSLAQCTDSTLVAWGSNGYGQLGDGSGTQRSVPVAVNQTGVLSGRSISGLCPGSQHSMVVCADGSLAAWGFNYYGQLGNGNTANRAVPGLVDTAALRTGERFVPGFASSSPLFSFAVVASPPPPVATTLAVSGITDTGATLNGTVNPNGQSTVVGFEYGLTTDYGTTAAPAPSTLTGTTAQAVAVTLSNLPSGTIHHYRVVATSPGGAVYGEDRTFITSNLAALSGLSLSAGSLTPGFASIVTGYSAVVPYATSSLTVTPVVENAAATIRVQGVTVGSGTASAPLALAVGNTTITVAVTPPGAAFSKAYTVVVTRSPETYVFNSTATVPVTTASFDATGRTIAFELGFAPPTGTTLTVVKNTGPNPIQGTFDDLPQGQRVELVYNGVVYPFLANYFGGTGNDLVLQWGNTRLLSWGENSSGQLGQDHTSQCLVPTPVVVAGALVGKQILSISVGQFHSLALCADGSIAAWGSNEGGRLGNGTTLSSPVPVAVDQTGVLAGKRVIAVSAGANFSLALCADGTLAAWGDNDYSQLGDGTYTDRLLPVAVDLTAGGFAGKNVSAAVAGGMHSVALCTDGTLVAWGYGYSGQLGNGTASYTSLPVIVTKGTVLTGKTIIGLAAGYDHSMALCSDGTLAAWGSNGWGAVGNNSATNATTPVAVVKTGVLSGKTLTAIAAGASNSLALCSDSTLATWGDNTNGRLGNGSTTYSKVPVAVTRTGVLSGKTVVAASPWAALCSDGALATWGNNAYGQLGNNSTTHSTTPVLANTTALRSGEKLVEVRSASNFHLAVVAAPPAPSGTTLAATGVGDRTCTVRGTAIANGQSTTVSFQYGLTTDYGWSVAATPSPVTGTAPVGVSAVLTGLLPGKTCHYRVVVTSGGGIVYGGDQEFTTTAQATLAGLVPSVGSLVPVLDPAVSSYSMSVLPTTAEITLTPTVAQQGAIVTVAGTPGASGSASGPLALTVGNTAIPVVVTAADGVTTMTYTVTVSRPPEVFAFNAATDVPVTAAAFDASGMTATFALGFVPAPGTVLSVVNQTGLEFIRGTFSNLAQGQEVAMDYAGVRYRFVANYFGGTGNDLVLQWANVRLMAWGNNSAGQIGNGGMVWTGTDYANRFLLVPAAVDASGVLAGKTVMAASSGSTLSLAICADGTLAAWGEGSGQLGNGTTAGAVVPVLVDRSGALAGRTVVALAVGSKHCLVLCADGTVAAWGDNASGQLGNNSTTASTVPVMVDTSGVLAGRKVVMIAATGDHNLALCGDGTLVAWGENGWTGQLGNNSTIDSSVPVLVETGGVLHGRRVVEIAAGGGHSAALCADGTLAVWGSNYYGQLGLGNKIDTKVPVALPLTGVLAGKTIRSVSACYYHTMVWCTDGTLAAWGYNTSGALGNNSKIDSMVPVAVVRSGVLSGKTVTRIATGWAGSGVLCSDGKMATWGGNDAGQLGNNSNTSSSVPVLVDMTGLRPGERFIQGQMNGIGSHSLALVGAVPEPSAVVTLAATATRDKETTLNGSVNANGSATTITFEYGLTTAYGTVVSATPATVTGTTATPVSAVLSGLPTGTTFHYRVIATSAGGVVKGEDRLVTTTDQATLAGLALSAGSLDPEFAPVTTAYAVTVPAATATLTVTPVASHADAVITVNGRPVASGAESEPVVLVEGNNVITVGVTSGAGTDTGSYTLRVLRVPQVFRFTSASTVGIAVSSLRAAGAEVRFELGFTPVPGCVLTVVDNTGPAMIDGVFDNLAHGQRVDLSFGGATYPFVANYYGGTGNDLVLQWAATKLFSWGYDYNGELGDNSTGSSSSQLPVAVYTAGVLAGKTVMAVSVGSSNAAALCADGTVASWGHGYDGRLGNGEWYNNAGAPVAVTLTGVLAGKKVVAVAVGGANTVALCADGTLATWGENASGQLGDNTTTYRTTPVLVDRSGVLAGKAVTAIACGENHSLVLCADGSLVAWGAGSYGQLGNGTTVLSKVPVAVTMTGALAGKTVTAIAAGDSLSFALCADGTVAAWGAGGVGQLGNGTTTNSAVPVLVTRTGVLAGKTVTGVAAGSGFGVARCADGTLAAWGAGSLLGAGGIANSNVPVLVNRSGVLAEKTVTSLAAGSSHTLVGCSDGSAAAWGSDSNGQLGDSTAGSSVTAPVAVATSTLPAGSRFMTVNDGGGSRTSVAMVALPPPPAAATLAATAVLDAGATLNASVQPNGVSTAVSFEYGPTTAYGTTVQASPATVTGTGSKSASYVLGGLTPGATYHFRVVLTSASGTMRGNDLMFTTTTLGTLAGLTVAPGSVFPAFDSTRTDYAVTVPNTAESLRLTPVTAFADAAVTVNGVATASGSPSAPVALAPGNTSIPVVVISADGNNTRTYQIVVTRLPETFAWPSATTVPVTAADFLAAGNAPPLSLGHAPVIGAALTVVNNTGSGPIQGVFDNLAQGQRVALDYGGITYPFIANYAGGTGNDLVLEWGNTRVMGWGWNEHSQLGTGTLTNATIPAAIPWTGELAGKAVRDLRAGFRHTLALTWDGNVVFAGNPNWGNTGTVDASFPTILPAAGALVGKTVVAVAADEDHNLALCADGTVAAWGDNYRGQLGNDGSSQLTTNTPVAVVGTGALAGKEIVGIEAGNYSSVALCADGTVVQWGWLSGSQYPAEISLVPVSMQDRGALVGKKVVKLRAGFNNWLALCSDGTLVCWGANNAGQFGNGTSYSYSDDRFAPVAVTMTGVLAGKTVKDIAVGNGTCLVLCADGTLVSWGSNSYGQLGIGNKTNSNVPVRVTQTGVLAGKTVVKVFAGSSQSYALCSDGSMASWGANTNGSLGNGTTTESTLPVLVSKANFATGEVFMTSGGSVSAHNHVLALSALPPVPVATTLAADGVTDNTATLRASVRPNGSATPVSFEYGRTSAYGSTVAATPATVTGGGATAVAANLTNLQPGTTYHFRVVATGPGGTALGEDMTFTTGTLATLSDLAVSTGALQPDFEPLRSRYSLTVSSSTTAVALTPVAAHPGTVITVNGVAVDSGSASAAVPVGTGNTVIPVGVTAADASASATYTVTVTRVPEVFEFRSAGGAALTAEEFDGSGLAPTFTLAFVPLAGTELPVVTQTGLRFFRGRFANLAQGQEINLAFNGIRYRFVADYFGGTGNDLVLRWAHARLTGTGSNSEGQLGDGSKTSRSLSTAVVDTGVLSGKTVVAVAAGGTHTVALCSDGTLAAWGTDAGWGANSYGQLGTGDKKTSLVPVAVKMTGALAGRRVVAVATGYDHSLVLCDDGAILGWGSNGYRQLGNTGANFHAEPVLLEDLGALAGREVVAITAAGSSNLALCADGTLAAWGNNANGELGDGTTVSSGRPVAVSRTGALADKTVVMIASGGDHLLALCTDGKMVAWGGNGNGQLGVGDTQPRLGPVAVKPVGALAGKTVVEVAAGNGFNLVRCSDNTLISWGTNGSGQLGNGTNTTSLVPVAVSATGVLVGKSIAKLAVGGSHCMVYCTDATLAGWGGNSYGALGNNTIDNAFSPVAASATVLGTGERFRSVWTNASAGISMILVASPPAAEADTLAATAVADARATLNGVVKPNGSATTLTFEYGLTESYGSVATVQPSPVSGGETAVVATLTNLIPGTLYHFRIKAISGGGVTTGADRTFITTQAAGLAALAPGSGALAPAFESRVWDYHFTVPNAVASVTLTPTAMDSGAVIKVAGAAVPSGAASAPVSLAVGNTPVSVRVTSGDGVSTQTYTVNITRLPAAFVFATAGTVPVNAPRFSAAGLPVDVSLGFAPSAGTELRVVDVTGPRPIDGRFSNLAQGQVVSLEFGGVSYPFVADYFGGTGNDLVLRWANTRLLAWGANNSGQLGAGIDGDSPVPVEIPISAALAGKTVTAIEFGGFPMQSAGGHRLALCSDGTLVAWGGGGSGQLGNNAYSSSNLPVAVDQSGVLAGKRIVRAVAGYYHNLALCEDGSLVAWGSNSSGALGNGTTVDSSVPVAVDQTGVLAGKTVIALEAGNSMSYALCADGTITRWGGNATRPVEVERTGALAGKTVVEIAAGSSHVLARCSDGTLVAWGGNQYGQLGDGSTIERSVPVAVVTTGVLSGKTVVQLAAGDYTSMVLCSDGTVAVWGWNQYGGGMGTGSTYSANSPNAVVRTGVLAGKTVVRVATSGPNFIAVCSDGFAATWGNSSYGMLGTNSLPSTEVPVALDLSLVKVGERMIAGVTGLAMVASPPKSAAQTLAATATSDTTATLGGRVLPNGGNVVLAFEYGLTESYGEKVAAAPATASGTATVEATATLSRLMPGTTYHCRFTASGSGGTATGEDFVFTTTSRGMLAGLEVDGETLHPAFTPGNVRYAITVPAGTDDIIVRPTASHPSASVTVNGSALSADGTATVALQSGSTAIDIAVIAGDGINAMTYRLVATRLPAVFGFASAGTVPASADAFDVGGLSAAFSLGFVPQPGTLLTVLDNTGRGLISGEFSNLPQGGIVVLEHGGIAYRFAADYYGGTGNDLVLRWADIRLLGWGSNSSGQLGTSVSGYTRTPVSIDPAGALAGKTVLQMLPGDLHCLAVCTDGSLAAWGRNSAGNLGSDAFQSWVGAESVMPIPIAVEFRGALAGRRVAMAALRGSSNLVLCTDGALVTWGGGDNDPLTHLPKLVDQTGVLAGKQVVAIAGGGRQFMALCADGTLASWGGVLGNGTNGTSSTPALVDRGGVLKGKTVVAIAAGGDHSMALCSDGTLAAWGGNQNGQLGDNTITSRLLPVRVDQNGVLAGKRVIAITAGHSHSLVLCADGTVAAWGRNFPGSVGNGTKTESVTLPVATDLTGVLAGKPIRFLAAGEMNSFALGADGFAAAWGYNYEGQLGVDLTSEGVALPAAVATGALRTKERFVNLMARSSRGFAWVATPPMPVVRTLAADSISDMGAAVHGQVHANGNDNLEVYFEYGLTETLGSVAVAVPPSVGGTGGTAVDAVLAGLLPGVTYHVRAVAKSATGTVRGEIRTFTTGGGAALAGLTSSVGTLAPAFTPTVTEYRLAVMEEQTRNLSLVPVAATSGATVTVDGSTVASGSPSVPKFMAAGNHTLDLTVASPSGGSSQTYRVNVAVVPGVARFASSSDVPVRTAGFNGVGLRVRFELAFAPQPGTRLLVVENGGFDPITSPLDQLAHGAEVILAYDGRAYRFLANYRGGDGNDLTLEWGSTRVVGWGPNYEMIGSGQTASSKTPVPTFGEGVLLGKTVFSVVAGDFHSLALCSDGTLAAWGDNGYGQVGNGSNDTCLRPVAVDVGGVLAGKTVTVIAAGSSHSLALCSDGSLAGWGNNQGYQLGAGAGGNEPKMLDAAGVLAGRTIIAITAGGGTSYALCSDGTVAAWGNNSDGNIGNGTLATALKPVLVDRSGVLAGRKVVSIAAGSSHVLALCADGALAAWGSNQYGQLGDNSNATPTRVPVLVNRSGVLAGKRIVGIAAGNTHSLVLCDDGTMAAWGSNDNGQLGDGSSSGTSLTPVAVLPVGALAGKRAVAVKAGKAFSLALCDDGTTVAWGDNANGQLGNGSTTDSPSPVAVDTANLIPGERAIALATAPGALTNLALTAMPRSQRLETLAATAVGAGSATLNGLAYPDGGALNGLVFEHGPTSEYGSITTASPATAAGDGQVAASATLDDLPPGTTWHYRLRGIGDSGPLVGGDFTFTTGSGAMLKQLAVDDSSVFPSFDSRVTRYAATVPFDSATIEMSLEPLDPSAIITVNATLLPAGSPRCAVPLTVGSNSISVVVTAGTESVTYTVLATRLPETLVFGSADDTPLAARGFYCGGSDVNISLRFAPPVGTSLTLVRNDGRDFIAGVFRNLPHGATVGLGNNGTTYQFVANYFGGDGNDLVLEWANTHWIGWGFNYGSGFSGGGALANGTIGSESRPVLAANTGVLIGRRILKVAAGGAHSLFLLADGTLAAAGDNASGELGINSTTDSAVGVAVDRSGVLAGKTVAAIAAGNYFSLALCADGTLAAWGSNSYGQLGDGTTSQRLQPVAVNSNGVLAGRKVVAITTGENHAGALCADGTVVAWGSGWGVLPQRVNVSSLAAHGRIVSLRSNRSSFLALCEDGSIFTWTATSAPAQVDATAFSGRKVVAISPGYEATYALCADGSVFAWGGNNSGQLGIGTLIDSPVPVAVSRTGPLAASPVTMLGSGSNQGFALCADGQLAAWGWNHWGQLGDGTQVSPRTTAVAVDLNLLTPGERVITPPGSSNTGTLFAQVAAPLPEVVTLPALNITKFTAKLRGNVLARGSETRIWFEYGTTTAYGMTAAGNPAQVHWKITTAATAADLAGLMPGTTYHYRVVAESDSGIVRGADLTFTTISDNALLAELGHDGGFIAPVFEKQRFKYWSSVPFATAAVTVSAVTDHPRATFTVNGGGGRTPVSLAVGNNTIAVTVTAEDGETMKTYTIIVNRLPQEFVFNTASDIPLTTDGFAAGGNPATLILNFAPSPGTILTMVNNTGLGFIYGKFGNLAQGQRVTLRFDGRNYDFIANYHGGTGNDLVLQWADTELLAWGGNGFGQLGDNTTERRLLPTPVNEAGVLAGKPVLAVAGGYLHSLALCADGTLAAWGYNAFGQLGNNGSVTSLVPAAVDQSGALAGKSVVAIAAGPFHNLALCEDGTIVSWGYNNHGQLGDGTRATRRAPVIVPRAGVLAGMQVVAVAAGVYQSFALGADGTVAAWGYNDEGELGDGTTNGSLVPVAVDRSGALAGKRVASLAAGLYHTLALCTDATLVTWGYNKNGQLGNNSTTDVASPVAINGQGVLAGMTPVGIGAGSYHSLARCADGTVATWGVNNRGQLGAAGPPQSAVPLAVDVTGVASGGGMAGLATGANHSLLRLADGRLAAWGENTNGQLGDQSLVSRALPAEVTALTGRIMAVASGAAAQHNLALQAKPMVQEVAQGAMAAVLTGTDLTGYAFQLDPSRPGVAQLPEGRMVEGEYVVSFTQPAGVDDVVYGAEWSGTMQPGSWQEIPDTGSGSYHRFAIPVRGSARGFIRLKVTAAAR